MNLVDIGVNLTNKSFSKDLPKVLAEAVAAGVATQILTGTCLNASNEALALVQAHSEYDLYSTAGVHPHDASTWDESTAQALRILLENEKVVAVGEAGLDFNRNFSTEAEQIAAFKDQVELAVEMQKPIFLHERDAHERFLQIHDECFDQVSAAIVHCFTGTKSELAAYNERGLYIGITGWICDERRGLELQRIVADIPDDKLMIETDAPYLLPRSMPNPTKTRRNEPAFLTWVVEKVAECRGQSVEHVAAITSNNAKQFFQLS